jgi:hypothetical protein
MAHCLKGDLRGFWAVTVRANWRIIWRFDGTDAIDVDLIDYHQENGAMPMKNPPHPGRIVRQECLEPLGLTVTDAAKALGVSRNALSELLNERRGIPRLRDYPVVRWGNDTKVVRDVVAECVPVRGHSVAEKCQHRGAEFLEGGIALVVCGVPVHQAP